MSRSLNKAMILGNLGSDPEVRSTSGGTKVATLSVATNRRWTDRQGNEKQATEWHSVVCWDGLAEVCERYLSKGDRIYVEGRIEYRSWTGDDGQKRYATEIRVSEMIMLGDGAGGGQRRPPQEDEANVSEEQLLRRDDDLPF